MREASRQRFRDDIDEGDNDLVEGNGGGDIVLGGNGTLLRVTSRDEGSVEEAVDAARYPADATPADAFRLRVGDKDAAGYNRTTRFCTESASLETLSTCEPAWAFGSDRLWGDDGDDRAWGQDGDDVLRGGSGRGGRGCEGAECLNGNPA